MLLILWTRRKEGRWCIYKVIIAKHQENEELGGVSPDDQSKVRMNVLEMTGRIQEEQPTTAITFSRVSLNLPPLNKGPQTKGTCRVIQGSTVSTWQAD